MNSSHTAALAEFCTIVQGGRLRLSGNDFVPTGYPAYGAGGMNGYLSVREFDRTAVVLSSIGARCGKCFYADGEWTSLANTQVIFPDIKRADPRFLWHQLNDEARWPRSGTAQPFIKPSDVKSHRVFLPPLVEQRRIAAILDQADALRSKRQAALAQLEEMSQAIFIEMFGDPALNPFGLPMKAFGSLMSEVYRYPTYYGIDYEEEGVAEVRGELIGDDGTICDDPNKLRFISAKTAARFGRTKLQEGDLVISVRGTVGKVGLVPRSLAGANITANLMRLAPDRSSVEPIFAWHLTQTAHFKSMLSSESSTTTIATIKSDGLKNILVPLPPLDRQQEFSKRVAAVQEVKGASTRSVNLVGALFASIQHRAFRGEL